MNISTFFSCLIVGMLFSGWGCSTLTGGEEGLPHLGTIPLFETHSDLITSIPEIGLAVAVPKEIDLTNMESAYEGLPCAKNLFPSVPSWEELVTSAGEVDDSGIIITNTNSLQGCLSVWWNKGEEGQTTGNVLWSMSDGDIGTLYLSKVSINGNSVEKLNENLYFIGKKQDEDAWEILIDRSKGGGYEEAVEEYTKDKGRESHVGSAWAAAISDSPAGKLDLYFVNNHSTPECGEKCVSYDTWIKDVSKWAAEEDLLMEAVDKYQSFNGYFSSEQPKPAR